MTARSFLLTHHTSHQRSLRERVTAAPLKVKRGTMKLLRSVAKAHDDDADCCNDTSLVLAPGLGVTLGQYCVFVML
jgi:hypothetical protein